uniref:Inactive polyglycylase TTLL10 isoform X2 n=1 Tax=Geotrypetes seraphini TaxID=260995 RepID=A0A6P8P8H8_GEOSA|nr:inactive polyglycylase TTLL10 isoform X2 [Geotrypetes seraphini]
MVSVWDRVYRHPALRFHKYRLFHESAKHSFQGSFCFHIVVRSLSWDPTCVRCQSSHEVVLEQLQLFHRRKQSLQKRLQDPDQRLQLRRKFLQQAQSYIGVPYAKKYHEPGTPEHESTLFLDCCGLIRRVMKDLKSEFGFLIGPGNQAYQFDTLPETVASEEEMQPGDLIFISGTYFSSQRKRQLHDMVHVEIWLGDGVHSLGARWQKGKVQIFDSYKFVSTSYGDMKYHFKSIETWLQGTCVSHCPEHKWGSSLAFPAGFDNSDSEPSKDAKTTEVKGSQKLALYPAHMEEKKQEDSQASGPFFYIGGKNGAHLVNDYCTSKGWQQLQDRKREDYILKWCESKCAATYCCFKAGEQLLYQIPNNKVLTTKIGLLNSLREYERVMNKLSKLHHHHRLLRLDEFFPETFRLDMKDEREAFFSLFKEGQTWICKPTSLNQGRGIFLLKTQEDMDSLRVQLDNTEEDLLNRKLTFKLPQARIVQRYIQSPLLLEGRKFDVRSYLLIACTVPYVVFFRHGYVRLTCNIYDPNSNDLTGHLTNQYMQKKHPQYKELKEDTVWSMERFNTYLNEKFVATMGLPEDWVLTVFTRMQQIMMQCFLAVKSKLECKLGYFDLIGCDFLIDEQFKVWVLEMNSNPALHTNCQVLKNIIPSVVNETLDLSLEIFYKSLKGQRVLPLGTQRSFVLLYNGDFPDQGFKLTRVKPSATAPKIQRSSKPEGDAEQVQKASKGLDKLQKTTVTSTKNSSVTMPTLSKFLQKRILSLPYAQFYELRSGAELRAGSAKLKGRNEQPVRSPGVPKQKALAEQPSVTELCKAKGCHAITVPLLIEQVIPIPQHLRMQGSKSQLTRKSYHAPSILTNQDLTPTAPVQTLRWPVIL